MKEDFSLSGRLFAIPIKDAIILACGILVRTDFLKFVKSALLRHLKLYVK